jgi:Helix-turn-helix domain
MPAVRKMLMLSDREEISRGLAEGLEYKAIATGLDRDPSVISREVCRHGGRAGYRAAAADEAARAGRERPKKLAVERSARLRTVVAGLLRQGWSPASIAAGCPSTTAMTRLAGCRTRRSTSGSTPHQCPPYCDMTTSRPATCSLAQAGAPGDCVGRDIHRGADDAAGPGGWRAAGAT